MGIRIITDSTSDIDKEQMVRLGIDIVPLKVVFGDNQYKEGVEISIEEFYIKLTSSEKLPTTSQPAPDDFLDYYENAKNVGDSVIVMLIASKISGTVQSASIAKEMVEYDDIHIIDSLSTTIGLRFLIEEAVKMKNEGRNAGQIVEAIEKLKNKIVFLALVDTLEYLHKGGRLSKSAALIGSFLKFKPILTLKDGAVELVGKERGTNKGIIRVLELSDEFGEIDQKYPIHLGYTAVDSKALMLKEKLIEKHGDTNINMYPVGCVIGTHVGPGACLLSYVKK